MSDDIPAAKRGRRTARPEGPATEGVTIRFTTGDFDALCRMMKAKRHEYLRAMLREWVLDRLGVEIARSRGFETPNMGGSQRVM